MPIGLIILLFLLSIILCGVSGEIVKRREIQVPRMALVILHLVYLSGLVAIYWFL